MRREVIFAMGGTSPAPMKTAGGRRPRLGRGWFGRGRFPAYPGFRTGKYLPAGGVNVRLSEREREGDKRDKGRRHSRDRVEQSGFIRTPIWPWWSRIFIAADFRWAHRGKEFAGRST